MMNRFRDELISRASIESKEYFMYRVDLYRLLSAKTVLSTLDRGERLLLPVVYFHREVGYTVLSIVCIDFSGTRP